MQKQSPTASIIVIGNEILSGRTEDKNINYIAKKLNNLGIRLMEVRVVPDIEETIISAVNEMRRVFTYVFTTGGIGPTHDDITSLSIAKAFGVKLYRHPDAVKAITKHYGEDEINNARLKMAEVPEGSELLENKLSSAPGFKKENVFVMAGIPRIMQSTMDTAIPMLETGKKILSKEISAEVYESLIAERLTAIQDKYPSVDIGSYPFDGRKGLSIVARSTDINAIEEAYKEIEELLGSFPRL